jgi:hypothetical protein
MNTLNPSPVRSRPNIRSGALLSLVVLLASGCATGPRPQAFADDYPDDWAARIQSLPVEVHGAVPGESAAQTVAAIHHGVAQPDDAEFRDTGLSLYAQPRVVLYVGGTSGPSRDRYCALPPDTNRAVSAAKDGVILRGGLCDGPRPVAYARITLAEADCNGATLDRAVEGLKSQLVASLEPPEPQQNELGY